jgi:hypothetical protein
MGWICSTYGEMRCAYKGLVGKCEEAKSHARPSRERKDNIKMELKEIRL